jgi:hypothetical protein
MSRIPLTLSHVYAMGERGKSRRRAAQRQRPITLTPPSAAVAGSGTTITFPVDSVNESVCVPDWAVQTPADFTNVSDP